MAGKAYILIADDEPDIAAVYQTKLESAGYTVATVANGKEAIASVRSKKPDLVLMDMKMPELDGIDATMQLKEDAATKGVKVVFLTAFSDPVNPSMDVTAAKELGAVDFIRKGISLDEFLARVEKLLA